LRIFAGFSVAKRDSGTIVDIPQSQQDAVKYAKQAIAAQVSDTTKGAVGLQFGERRGVSPP